ncbi:acetyl-CoA carboxylase carboxyltransferase subunit alpha [Chlamydiifrater phoenicopteri]|uniref:acetyl-CoA carboxylase carboxyltransferase subunit alpha n=1 Tax=Chlamydiifrater phoenicopteri TaxID=2681469 RepID=UPI001BD18049|nr:acetyl-CoA carboxylase carboxyltransferase subunit alpha [Chlamydiifrater phoenicopteri]
MELLPHEKQVVEYEKTIAQFKKKNKENSLLSSSEIQKLEKRLDKLKEKIYSDLTPWERVQICRHPARPRSVNYIEAICENFVELCGDRTFREDPAVVGGLAKIGSTKFMVIGQEKGHDTASRVHRNFGMLNPEGFRKALRLAEMAEKFGFPVVFLLDTPGAYPGLTAEERGQGRAIAYNLFKLSRLATPIIVLVIGEGCSGGALGMGVGDVVGMLEHSYYSVISPEGCASILWKDPKKNSEAAAMLKMHAEDLLGFSIIDAVIKEPIGGAHHQPETAYRNVKEFILSQWNQIKDLPLEELLEKRYRKFRNIGIYEATAEGGSQT